VTKDEALAALAKRRSLNQPKVIDNASLPAGSPMYYYCHVCDALVAVKDESWYRDPPPKLCSECFELKEAGLIE
jgi:hypothetical protein